MAYINNPYLNPYIYGNQPVQAQQPQQQDGFIGVQNEQEARAYPVAPGKSVTFRDESEPYRFYTKTMGNSPLENPIFERFRLVKEDSLSNVTEPPKTEDKPKDLDLSIYMLKDDLKPVLAQLNNVKNDISFLKDKIKKKVVREVSEYDE